MMLCRDCPSEVVPVPRVRLGSDAPRFLLKNYPLLPVPRVRLGSDGLRELAGHAVCGAPVAAELVDADGEVCGRARRDSGRDPMPWHVQLGGVLASRRWAAVPMGCGRGDDPQSAARAAIEDLRRQASSRARAAETFSEFFLIF